MVKKSNLKKLKLRRIKIQERGDVYRWYEGDKGNITASIVEGPFPDELEYRIGDAKWRFESISSRGSKKLIMKKSDAYHKRKIKTLIRRELLR